MIPDPKDGIIRVISERETVELRILKIQIMSFNYLKKKPPFETFSGSSSIKLKNNIGLSVSKHFEKFQEEAQHKIK